MRRNTLLDFWAKVDVRSPSECWTWKGHLMEGDYGRFRLNGRNPLSHRLSLELVRGVLSPDLYALHTCDNPPCVNPSHLYWGTQSENMRDMANRSRGSGGTLKGDAHPNSKLTDLHVREIRSLHAAGGITQAKLAHRYSVSTSLIGQILRGKARVAA